VVHIDRHRSEPLDEASALLLAQHFATAGAAYPYFATLSDLDARHFEQFFRLADRLRDLPWQQLNPIMAQLHSLIEILCLARESDALSGKAAAEIFALLCERFAKSTTPADFTVASLDVVRELIAQAAPKDAANADEALERMLLGSAAPAVWNVNGETHTLDAIGVRRTAFRKVLAAQP